MNEKSKRAIRRHHIQRLKKARKNYNVNYTPRGTVLSDKKLGQSINTPTPCSCPMCRNERSNPWASEEDKLTIQERKHSQEDIDVLVAEAMAEIEMRDKVYEMSQNIEAPKAG